MSSNLIRETLRIDEEFILSILTNQLGISFQNYDTFTSTIDPNITDLSMLKEEVMRILLISDRIRPPKIQKYWDATFEKVLARLQVDREKQLAARLQYNHAHKDRLELYKLVRALTGDETRLTVEVLSQFIMQIKRKINGLPITYHIMPILYGKQKSGKSETIRKFLGPIKAFVYNGSAFNIIGDDRYARAFTLNYCFFFDEMRKVQHADIESVKERITAPEVSWRILGHNKFVTKPNKASFIGASNLTPASLLRDNTGMRRFFYIKCLDKIDWDLVNSINFLEVWRSVNELRDGAYTLDVADEFEAAQEQWRPKDPIEEMVSEEIIVKDEGAEVLVRDVYEEYKNRMNNDGNGFGLKRENFEAALRERFGITIETKRISKTQTKRIMRARFNKPTPHLVRKF